ncbi:hypothetical protein ACIBHX_47040 [Nonomuraea sp. NPDC050536]|uniref:hypothetical protein n=1 Tax=Nonomuraea sp. NPDC050536 TaxID=3364366 RepID=UPI0037C76D6F
MKTVDDQHTSIVAAAQQVAAALGMTPAELDDVVRELAPPGRRAEPTPALLLAALGEIVNRAPDQRDLVGAVEVAKILDVSRQRVHQLAERPDFPRPRYELAAGKLWARADIIAYKAKWPRRVGRPRKTSEPTEPKQNTRKAETRDH